MAKYEHVVFNDSPDAPVHAALPAGGLAPRVWISCDEGSGPAHAGASSVDRPLTCQGCKTRMAHLEQSWVKELEKAESRKVPSPGRIANLTEVIEDIRAGAY